jgi:8-oxo-dGTP pyrophosphatase MutT (NUDIX family)
MQLVSENLVIIERPSRDTDSLTPQVLVGTKKRGMFAGYDTFPGGKAENKSYQFEEAAREAVEETGMIGLSADRLRYVGKLLISDLRPASKRFGNVFLYTVNVDDTMEAQETDELLPRWVDKQDPTLTRNMPPDVGVWWPIVSEDNAPETITHVMYAPNGDLEVITKLPDIAQMEGDILSSMAATAHDLRR